MHMIENSLSYVFDDDLIEALKVWQCMVKLLIIALHA